MGWNDRDEAAEGGSLINLGPDPKTHKQRFTGLLLGFRRHPRHPDRERVWAMDKAGNEVDIVGNVAIMGNLKPDDVGKLIDLEFVGTTKLAGGNTRKDIKVRVWEDAWTTAMIKWSKPCYDRALQIEEERAKQPAKGDAAEAPPPGDDDAPPEGDEESDDLPF